MFVPASGAVAFAAQGQLKCGACCPRHEEIGTQVTLELIFIGLAITLEPIPLTAFILVVSSKGGVKKGAAFIFGWLLSLAIIIALTVLVTGNKPPKPSTAPSLAALAVKIAIGVGLLLIALRQRRRMGRPKKPKKTPKWQTGIDNMSLWFAIALAPLVQPWGLVAAGVADITEAKLSSAESYLAPGALLSGFHRRLPRHGDLCGILARASPGVYHPLAGLDRNSHRSSHHHRVGTAGLLADREERLSHRHLTAAHRVAGSERHFRTDVALTLTLSPVEVSARCPGASARVRSPLARSPR